MAVVLALAGAALAGCGGGGDDGPGEEALRAKIEKSFEKVAESDAIRVALDFQVGEDEETTVGGCLQLTTDNGKPGDGDDRVEMKAIANGCDGGAVSAQVIAVGRDVWVRKGQGHYRPGRIDPSVLPELTGDTADFHELPAAAEDISETSEPEEAVYPETNEQFKGPRYEFKAPASAFSAADAEELGDTDVDFEAGIDHRGYLRELVGTVEAEGAKGVITVTYDDIGRVEPIEPPPPGEVSGEVTPIHSEAELESLIEGPFSSAF
jgi:hypothetical protein